MTLALLVCHVEQQYICIYAFGRHLHCIQGTHLMRSLGTEPMTMFCMLSYNRFTCMHCTLQYTYIRCIPIHSDPLLLNINAKLLLSYTEDESHL